MKSKTAKPTKKRAKPAATTAPAKPIPPLLSIICRALDEKKAGELRVLRVSEQSSITDYLVVATGTSEPHLRALRVELEKAIDATGTRIIGMDTGETGSGWLVIDAFDVMIHVLTQENRERYSLESLWKDAGEIPLDELLGTKKTKPKAKTKPAKSVKAAKPKAKPSVKKPAKSPAKKSAKKPAKKAPVKKTIAKKTSAKKAPAKKTPVRKKAAK